MIHYSSIINMQYTKGVLTSQRRGEVSYSFIEGEMLAVTKFKSRNDVVWRCMTLFMPYKA